MWSHRRYLWGRHAFPLSLPVSEDFIPTDRKFQDLKSLEPTPPPLTGPPHPKWMSEPKIRLIDERASLSRNPRHNSNVAHNLAKAVRRSLLVDYRWLMENSAKEIRACLETMTGIPDIRGAYGVLKMWYRHVSTREPNPSRADMAKVTGDYATL